MSRGRLAALRKHLGDHAVDWGTHLTGCNIHTQLALANLRGSLRGVQTALRLVHGRRARIDFLLHRKAGDLKRNVRVVFRLKRLSHRTLLRFQVRVHAQQRGIVGFLRRIQIALRARVALVRLQNPHHGADPINLLRKGSDKVRRIRAHGIQSRQGHVPARGVHRVCLLHGLRCQTGFVELFLVVEGGQRVVVTQLRLTLRRLSLSDPAIEPPVQRVLLLGELLLSPLELILRCDVRRHLLRTLRIQLTLRTRRVHPRHNLALLHRLANAHIHLSNRPGQRGGQRHHLLRTNVRGSRNLGHHVLRRKHHCVCIRNRGSATAARRECQSCKRCHHSSAEGYSPIFHGVRLANTTPIFRVLSRRYSTVTDFARLRG